MSVVNLHEHLGLSTPDLEENSVLEKKFYEPPSLQDMCAALAKSKIHKHRDVAAEMKPLIERGCPLVDDEIHSLVVSYQHEFGTEEHPLRPKCDPEDDPDAWYSFAMSVAGPLFFPTEAWQGRLEHYMWPAVYAFLNKTGCINKARYDKKEYQEMLKDNHFLKLLRFGNSQTFEAYDFDLSLRESAFLKFVRARTWRWYKFSDIITKNQLKEGIKDKTGEYVQAPFPASYDTARRAIPTLLSRGEITKYPVAYKRESGGDELFAYMPLNRTVLCQSISMRLCSEELWKDFWDFLKRYRHDNGSKLNNPQLWLADNLFRNPIRCTGAAWLERQNGRLSDMSYGLSVPLVFGDLSDLRSDIDHDIDRYTTNKDGVRYFVLNGS